MIQITRVTLTPMQRIIVEWDSDNNPVGFTVSAVNAGHTVTELVAGDQRIARVQEQLPLYRTYIVTVSDGTETSDPYYISVDVKSGVGNLLRQAVFDSILEADITDANGRELHLYHTGLYVPDDVVDGEVIDTPLPALEIQMPTMTGTPDTPSLVRSVETWEIPFRIWDEGTDNTPESISETYHLLELIQTAIEQTGDLNLSARGVMWGGWDFSAPEQIEGRDRVSGLAASVIIPVQRIRRVAAVS